MNDLTVINFDGKLLVDSREVAVMVDKYHAHLMRDIDGYISILQKMQNPILDNGLTVRVSDFFIESEYESGTPTRKYRCFLLTRKGCDMVANKMTGEKGVLFTATYVTKFEEMEKQLAQSKLPQTYADALRELADSWEQNQKLLPKADAFDQFMDGGNNQKMNVVAKTLGIGRNKLFSILRERKILMSDNTPYQEYADRGYFVVKEKPITMGDQSINKPQTFVTPKGLDYIRKLLNERKVG